MISAPNWSVWEVLLKFQSGSLRQLLKQNQPTSDPQKSLSSGNLACVCEIYKNNAAGIT